MIKSVIADSLGMHLDMLQRIQVDPCSLTAIRYTPLRPFLLRMNDTGGRSGVASLAEKPEQKPPGATGTPRRDRRRRGRRGGRIGSCAVYTYDPPERFVAGTVGQPGERTFYLQASGSGRVTSVAVEKIQVHRLAERLDELLDEELRSSGGKSSRGRPSRPPASPPTRRSTCRCWRNSG